MRKSVFSVSDHVRLKATCSATEAIQNVEIHPEARLDIMLSNKQIITSSIGLRGCVGWSASLLFACKKGQVFSQGGPIKRLAKGKCFLPYNPIRYAHIFFNF